MPNTSRLDVQKPSSLLNRKRFYALVALWIFAIGYGCLVEIRGALIHNRHTDVGAYFSAAWSIRIGSDPYYARDVNGWHYTYPPLLAVLISPLADAPPTMHRYWLLPYPLSVGIWYCLSVACLAVAVNRLAQALFRVLRRHSIFGTTVESSGDLVESDAFDPEDPSLPARGTSRRWAWRWWILCFWPLMLCVPAICRSVIRGQVGPLWLLLICLMIADVVEKKHLRAGVWLAAAICLKVIPAFLLMYPLYRRNGRMLLGCGLGMLAGFVLIPWAAMGTHEFFAANQHYLQSFVFPAITGGRIDSAVEHELTDPITSDTNSFVAILMNTGNIFFHTPRDYTPPLFAKVGHWLIGGAMTLLTIAAAGNRRRNSLDEALFLGLLAVVVLPIAPVCHPHYYMMMLPLIAAVLATFLGPRGQKKVTSGWIVLLMMVPLSHIITSWPGMEIFRDTGLVTWVAVAFWAKSTWLLWTRQHSVQQVDENQPEYLSATAVFA